MTIFPETVVVARNDLVSFMVPLADLAEAVTIEKIPDDFLEDSLRGFPVLEHRVTAKKDFNGQPAARVMLRHPKDKLSRVNILESRQHQHKVKK